MGNPHLVLHLADLESVSAETDGAALESMVPGGINVHFMAVEGPDHIRLLHHERGAGVTQACGSGATAAAVATHEWGLTGPEVRVTMPGGDATVVVDTSGDQPAARLRGPATHVGEVIV